MTVPDESRGSNDRTAKMAAENGDMTKLSDDLKEHARATVIETSTEEEVDSPEPEEELEEEEVEPVPDGSWGWAVVVGAVIIHVYIGGFMKSSGVMYLKLKDKFDQSATATAWVFSLFTTFLLMMGPVASAMCQRMSCRTVVFLGSILSFLGVFISAFSPNLEFLYFSYGILGGFGRCLTYTPSLILVTHYFNKKRGLAVGLSTAGVGLGMFSFPLLIDMLYREYAYAGAMILLSGIGLQSFICSALFRPLDVHRRIEKVGRVNRLVKEARRGSVDAREEIEKLTKNEKKKSTKKSSVHNNVEDFQSTSLFSSTTEFTIVVPPPTRGAEMGRRKSIFIEGLQKIKSKLTQDNGTKKPPLFEVSLLKDFPFLSLCIAILLFTMSMMATFVFLPPLAKSRGVSESQAAYLVSIIGVCDSVARFTSGFLLDMKRVKPFRIFVYNGVMFGVGIVSMVMPNLYGFISYAVISGCYGVLAGIYVAQKSVVVVDILGLEKMTSSFGMLLAFQGIGSLVGPTVAGLFRDVFGSYEQAFYFGGIGIFLGGLVLACGNTWKVIRDRRANRNGISAVEAGDATEDGEISVDEEGDATSESEDNSPDAKKD